MPADVKDCIPYAKNVAVRTAYSSATNRKAPEVKIKILQKKYLCTIDSLE